MKIRKVAEMMKTFMIVLFVAQASTLPMSSQGASKSVQPVVVIAEMLDHKLTYKVDGKLASPDLLRVLSVIAERRGHDTEVIVLIDSHAPINEVGNIEGTCDKAELTKIRYFIFNRAANVMSTIEFGQTVPFSARPVWK
jgi:hypothetical protein